MAKRGGYSVCVCVCVRMVQAIVNSQFCFAIKIVESKSCMSM